MRRVGWSTVASGGETSRPMAMPSKPATEMSAGTASPISRTAAINRERQQIVGANDAGGPRRPGQHGVQRGAVGGGIGEIVSSSTARATGPPGPLAAR